MLQKNILVKQSLKKALEVLRQHEVKEATRFSTYSATKILGVQMFKLCF